jgi:UrcA family protein
MNIRNTLGLAALAAGLATAFGATAATTPPGETRSVVVRYHASDLNSRAGAERLLKRVSGAAMRVCSDEDWMDFEFDSRDYHQCRKAAIADAVEQVNRPTLTAAYDRHFGGSNVHRAAAMATKQAHAIRPVAG